MGDHLFHCLENNRLTCFPKTPVLNHEAVLKKLNTDVRSSDKWTTPKKRSNHSHPFPNQLLSISIQKNDYSALSQELNNLDNAPTQATLSNSALLRKNPNSSRSMIMNLSKFISLTSTKLFLNSGAVSLYLKKTTTNNSSALIFISSFIGLN